MLKVWLKLIIVPGSGCCQCSNRAHWESVRGSAAMQGQLLLWIRVFRLEMVELELTHCSGPGHSGRGQWGPQPGM